MRRAVAVRRGRPGDHPRPGHGAPSCARRRARGDRRGPRRPSPGWRFRFSLMLGLERVLAERQPALLNGLTLRPHQVDALAGMLAALTAGEERERCRRGRADGGTSSTTRLTSDEAQATRLRRRAGELEEEEARTRTTRTTTRTARRRHEAARGERARPRRRQTRRRGRRGRSGRGARDPRSRRRAPLSVQASRRHRARRSPPRASSRRVVPSACSSSPIAACSSTSSCGISRSRATAPRLIGAIEKGKRLPRQPAVAVETYAWFIKHAADIHPDAYGVVICDEAHTALGERTAETIRALQPPRSTSA